MAYTTSHIYNIECNMPPKGRQSPFTLTKAAQAEVVLPLSAPWSGSVKWGES